MPKQKIYHLQYRPHRPVTVRRWVWRPINKVQHWLEAADKPAGKVVAYSLLVLTAMYFTAALLRDIL